MRYLGLILDGTWCFREHMSRLVPRLRTISACVGRLMPTMAQVLTGHGCFGEYLCRIGRERTTQCHHCDHDHDSAQHTLQDCPAWSAERVVIREFGCDLSLPTVVGAIVGSEKKWGVLASFCEAVLSQKEAAKEIRRTRQRDGDDTRAKEGYLAARKTLKFAIAEAKRAAWEQLTSSLDDDP
ncbi:uncharacterized protein LOC112589187 [Harpegnathos saltator]|uniref:uncharacterized protein LOC112589187 n=1 Tax=Harpegnathos saltator TaxID=610380 RepID=UPI000DBEE7D6|nr:uncharacterized protein LOC112589187 [Harpegnathos saltator]